MSDDTTAREVAGNIPRETFERAVEAAAKAVCAHRSYRMIAAEVLAAVDYAGAIGALEQIASLEYDTKARQREGILGWIIAWAKAGLPTAGGQS